MRRPRCTWPIGGHDDAFEKLVRVFLDEDAVVNVQGSLSSPLTHR